MSSLPSDIVCIDTSLMRAVIDGDDNAWTSLVEIYSPSLNRFMARCKVRASDRASLSNEVFLEAYQSIATFTGQNRSRSFLKWLWTIARRRVIRFIEREKRRPDHAPGGDSSCGLVANLPEIPAEPTADDKSELLRNIIEKTKLEHDDLNLLQRYYMEGLTATQIAKESEQSADAVRQKVARLLMRIREQTAGLEPW